METIKNKYHILLVFFFLASFPAISHCSEIRLSVAASMTDAIRELAAAFSPEHHEVSMLINSGSSGSLAKQIVHGAPADLFISANVKWMDYLVREGKINRTTVRVCAGNSLVFVGSSNIAVSSLDAIPSLSRIAIGSPQSVPAGQYAEQALRAAGFYEDLRDRNRLVMAKDVRQALLYADRGEVDGAFIYKTDALQAERAVIRFTVPQNLHDRIDYTAGLTPEGRRNEAARSFHTFLTGPEALTILVKYGFSAPALASAGIN